MANHLYFRNPGDENCFSLEYHIAQAQEEGLTEIYLYRSKVDKVPGYFWCIAFSSICETGGDCGRECPEYKPRNGKSGICANHYHFRTHYKREKFVVPMKQIELFTPDHFKNDENPTPVQNVHTTPPDETEFCNCAIPNFTLDQTWCLKCWKKTCSNENKG